MIFAALTDARIPIKDYQPEPDREFTPNSALTLISRGYGDADANDQLATGSYLGAYRLNMPTVPTYTDLSAAVVSARVSVSTSTDAPENSRLRPGFTSRSATVVLGGPIDQTNATRTAAWLFNPWNPQSPLYRARRLMLPVTLDYGITIGYDAGAPYGTAGNTYWYRQITGYIDGARVNAKTGNVELRIVDGRAKYRGSVDVDAVVTGPPISAGLTNEFVMDALLRASTYVRGDVSTWPRARANAIFAAGLRTSLWAETGTINTDYVRNPPVFARGYGGSGLAWSSGTSGIQQPQWNVTGPVTTKLFFEALIYNMTPVESVRPDGVSTAFGASDGKNGYGDALRINLGQPYTDSTGLRFTGLTFVIGPGGASIVANYPSSGGVGFGYSYKVTAAQTGLYMAVAITITKNTATSWTYNIDYMVKSGNGNGTEVFTNLGSISNINLDPAQFIRAGIDIGDPNAVVAGVQITTESNPIDNRNYYPTAYIDASLNPLMAAPAVSGDPWSAFQQMASSERGVTGIDEFGNFVFYNRNTLKSFKSGQAYPLNSTKHLAGGGLDTEESASALYNHAKVGYTSYNYGARTLVWNQTTPVSIPAKQTLSFETTPSSDGALFASADLSVVNLPNNGNPNDGNSWFRASTTQGGVAEHPGGLVFTIQQTGPGKFRVTIVNTSTVTAWLVTPSNYTDITVGTPSLWIGGVPVTPADEVKAEYQWPPLNADGTGGAASDTFLGDQLYDAPSNPYRQVASAANSLAIETVSDGRYPAPLVADIPIHPDPRIPMYTTVRLQDPDFSGIDDYGTIWGMDLSLARGQWSQSISVTMAGPPGQWLLGIAGRSELGQTTVI